MNMRLKKQMMKVLLLTFDYTNHIVRGHNEEENLESTN
jgi:hypothetical protein